MIGREVLLWFACVEPGQRGRTEGEEACSVERRLLQMLDLIIMSIIEILLYSVFNIYALVMLERSWDHYISLNVALNPLVHGHDHYHHAMKAATAAVAPTTIQDERPAQGWSRDAGFLMLGVHTTTGLFFLLNLFLRKG